ncbi:MAG: helix-turn-helix transcriptional regulator [Gaiellaceae bacterium]
MNLTLAELGERVKARRELPTPDVRRSLRRGAGISAADLAQVVGVSEGAVLAWETGRRAPSGRNLDRYVAALHILRGGP